MIAFIVTLTLVALYAILLGGHIRKHNVLHYAHALVWLGVYSAFMLFPDFFLWENEYVRDTLSAFSSGIAGTALFVIVMYTGALDDRFWLYKRLMKIRKELSIMGSYLLLGHCIIYIVQYRPWIGWLFLTGLAALIVLIPLFVTSFVRIRKSMSRKGWKKLQRYAYLFYFLTYVHMVVANMGSGYLDEEKLASYTVIFGHYTFLRVRKAGIFKRNRRPAVRTGRVVPAN